MIDRLGRDLNELMLTPGLSGHEERVRRLIETKLRSAGIASLTDRLGNLIVNFDGDPDVPSVMLIAHMDQLGFVVRKIEGDGLIRVARLGGVPARALASQAVLLCVAEGRDVAGVIGNKNHHATTPAEKSTVLPVEDLMIDTGHSSRDAVRKAGISIGTPVIYRPSSLPLAGQRIAGTSVDDRAGCAVLLEVAKNLASRKGGATVHIVFTVQEEFNLRGAVVAAQALSPDIAIQIDLMLACDTPDTVDQGDMRLGGGPGISLYSFHGRGTLNGVIPHPAMVQLFENAARAAELPLQRSAQVGILTDLSYVQTVGAGVAAIDIGFPMRYSHSSLEVCDLNDLASLTTLILTAIGQIGPDFPLNRGSI
ncbi:MAG: M20/M25/M40 family metallo-hydrolase [Paracoccaceae bacterium]